LAEIASFGINTDSCHFIQADLRRDEDIYRSFAKIRGLCDGLHGVINNAALPSNPGSLYPLLDDPTETWDEIMSTNVRAAWLLTRTAVPHMLATGSVNGIFVTSEAGWAGTPGFGMYNISKAALNSLGHSMARELAARFPKTDIQINVVVADEALTEMNQGSSNSPYRLCSIVLLLLSHGPGGPNGKYFHSDGSHYQFGHSAPYDKPLW
jgi:NAD(P)-dependent dehydrogenase (short-subunit alcohol dehydrogenase family)